MTYTRDTRTDAEVFLHLQREANAKRDVDEMARDARRFLTEQNGYPPLKVKTDAPLTLTGQ